MCVVSMIGDHYRDKWDKWKDIYPNPYPINPWPERPGPGSLGYTPPIVTKEEFDALKKEVEEMKALLIRAKEYDEKNGEPDCEMSEKVELLKKIAEMVGVDLSEVFKDPK